MLLMFKGNGCGDCPFCYTYSDDHGDGGACSISERYLADGTKLPVLIPCVRRPDGCPFDEYPSTLEVSAEEET